MTARTGELLRKSAAIGAVGMGILLVQEQVGLSVLGTMIAGVLTAAAVPAYFGKPWGVLILRVLYWAMLVCWILLAAAYYVVGPIGGTARAPGTFLTIVILWCVGGIAALAKDIPKKTA